MKQARVGAILAVYVLCAMASAQPTTQPAGPHEKAQRYLTILAQRPEPGYLFDRFSNAWLETGTVKGLEQFLIHRATTSGQANDQVLLALFYEKEGQDVRALGLYAEAAAKSPDSASILYYKATLESYTLNFSSAIADLKRALTKSPERELAVRVRKLLGKCYLRDGQDKLALATWRALVQTAPDDLDLKEDVMELQLAEGLFDEAVGECKALLAATTAALPASDVIQS